MMPSTASMSSTSQTTEPFACGASVLRANICATALLGETSGIHFHTPYGLASPGGHNLVVSRATPKAAHLGQPSGN
jgi:hypothetical protein